MKYVKLFEQFVQEQQDEIDRQVTEFGNRIINALVQCNLIEMIPEPEDVTLQLESSSKFFPTIYIDTADHIYEIISPGYTDAATALESVFNSYDLQAAIEKEYGEEYSDYHENYVYDEVEDFAIAKFADLQNDVFTGISDGAYEFDSDLPDTEELRESVINWISSNCNGFEVNVHNKNNTE